MRKLRSILILSVVVTLLIQACNSRKTASISDSKVDNKSDFTTSAWAWSDSIVARMDTAELVGQLLMPASYSVADAYTMQQVIAYARDMKVGGIVWLRGDTLSMRQLSDTISEVSKIPLLMAVDAEWGLAMRFVGMKEYRRNPDLGAVSENMMYDYGRELGRDALRLGINTIFAPVLDVVGNPKAVIRNRSYGSDPADVASKGCAFARGVADAGVLPVAKHFPGLGAATTDSHHGLPVVNTSMTSVYNRDLQPFREYINLGIGGIMTAHVYISALDSIQRPATFSPCVIEELLRRKMDFRGLVFTDAMNMKALGEDQTDDGQSRFVSALLAGNDLLLAPYDTHRAIEEITSAITDGRLPLTMIREKVRRILMSKYCLLKRI